MCRHDSCWGICAWWSVKPDTSGKHFPQDVLFCPCVCLKIPSPGPTWAPPVRRRRTLGGVRVIHARQDADTSLMVLHYLWILGCALWVACDEPYHPASITKIWLSFSGCHATNAPELSSKSAIASHRLGEDQTCVPCTPEIPRNQMAQCKNGPVVSKNGMK